MKQARTRQGKRTAAESARTATRRAPAKSETPFQHSPSVTAEIWETVLLLLSEGRGLLRICREHPEFPGRGTILRAVSESSPEQQNTYARACEDGADAMIEDAMDIADDTSRDTITKTGKDGAEYDAPDHEWISRSKLRVEQRRWHASKLKPKKYGEKLDVTSDNKPLSGATARDQAAALLAQAAELRARLTEGGK